MEEICPTCGIELDGAVHDCSHREAMSLEKEVQILTPVIQEVVDYLKSLERLYL